MLKFSKSERTGFLVSPEGNGSHQLSWSGLLVPPLESRKLWKRNCGWQQRLFCSCRSMVFCLIISLVQVRAGKLNAGDVVLENSKIAWPDRILPGLLYFFFLSTISWVHSVTDVFRNPFCLHRKRTNFCKVTLFCYYISNANKRMTKMASRMRITVRSCSRANICIGNISPNSFAWHPVFTLPQNVNPSPCIFISCCMARSCSGFK